MKTNASSAGDWDGSTGVEIGLLPANARIPDVALIPSGVGVKPPVDAWLTYYPDGNCVPRRLSERIAETLSPAKCGDSFLHPDNLDDNEKDETIAGLFRSLSARPFKEKKNNTLNGER